MEVNFVSLILHRPFNPNPALVLL